MEDGFFLKQLQLNIQKNIKDNQQVSDETIRL